MFILWYLLLVSNMCSIVLYYRNAAGCLSIDMQTVVCRPLGGGFCVQNGINIGPKSLPRDPKWNQNGSQVAPRRPLGASWPPEGLLERSWRSLGWLLERFWEPPGQRKTNHDRLLAAPRRIMRLVSAMLEAKSVQNRVQLASRARHTIPSITHVFFYVFHWFLRFRGLFLGVKAPIMRPLIAV